MGRPGGEPELERAFWCCRAAGWVVRRELGRSKHFSINPAFPLACPGFNFSAISSSIWSSIERAEMTYCFLQSSHGSVRRGRWESRGPEPGRAGEHAARSGSGAVGFLGRAASPLRGQPERGGSSACAGRPLSWGREGSCCFVEGLGASRPMGREVLYVYIYMVLVVSPP